MAKIHLADLARTLVLLAAALAIESAASGQSPPANNECDADAQMFSIPESGGGGGCASGLLDGATRDLNSGAACANSYVDVYWYFTPSATATYRLATCGSTFDTVLSVHTGCPATTANQIAGGCNDDSCSLQSVINSVSLTAGVTYRVRVAASSSTRLAGVISLEVRPTSVPSGACCVPATGSCNVIGPACCTSPSTFMAGLTCTPNPCPSPVGACCNEIGCSITTLSLCGSPAGLFFGLNSVCMPTSCVANDRCATAIVIPGAGGTVTGTTLGATTTPGGGGCSATSRDVWYAFNPVASGAYGLSMCATTPEWDSILGVFTGCVGTTANVVSGGCNDDGCTGQPGPSSIASLTLNAGTNYYIRVGGYGNTGVNAGDFTLSIGRTGACCNADTGVCTLKLQALCGGAPNTWQLGTACAAGVCDQFRGACCDAGTGVCSLLFPSQCAANFLGRGTSCQPGTCDGGACCTDGMCTFGPVSGCTGGVFQGNLSSCSPNPCPPLRACCFGGGCCEVVLTNVCTGAVREQVTCAPNPCGSTPYHDECAGAQELELGVPLVGSNCLASDSAEAGAACRDSGRADLWFVFAPTHTAAYSIGTCGSSYDTVLSLYSGNCDQLAEIGCNDDDPLSAGEGGCAIRSASRLLGQVLEAGRVYTVRLAAARSERGDFFLVLTNDLLLGSCCLADGGGGGCTQTDQFRCAGQFTVGGVCALNPCSPVTGACCCGAHCTATVPDVCAATGGSFVGTGTVCSPYSTASPCCRGDFNRSGAVSVQDIFDFLSGYFSASLCADANDSGSVSVQDIFDFLTAYFSGC